MIRWWAAFFIAGLASPAGGRGGAAAIVVCGLAIAGAAIRDRKRRMPFDRSGAERADRAVAFFALLGASSIIVWQCAGAPAPDGIHPSHTRENIGAGIRSLSLDGARSRLLDALDDGRLDGRARGFVGALVLDERGGLDFRISEAYSYVGITHFLALSGMHLGAIAIPLSWILSRLIRSRRRSDIALLGVLCLYSALAGCPASLLRALFLTAAFIAYRLIGLHGDLIDALVAGSFACVALDPSIASDVGFQLSFSAVCAIALIAVPLSRSLETRLPGGIGGTIMKAILFPALITCAVQFLTLPLVIHFFKRVSCYSPIVNVVISFPFTVLLYAGLIYVFVPWGLARALVAPGINLLCRFLESAPGVFARGPHAGVYRGDFHVGAYLLGAATVAWALRRSCPRRRLMLIGGAACVALAFCAADAPMGTVPGSRRAADPIGGPKTIRRVSCRDAEYLGTERGIMFIGPRFSSGDAYRFTRALWGEGVRRVGVCVVAPSHLRKNHGVFYLLRRIRVDEVVCSPYLLMRDADLRERLAAMGAGIRQVSAGDTLRDGRRRLEVIAPPFPPPRGAPVSGGETNLAWRYIERRITLLDLPPGRGYHPKP